MSQSMAAAYAQKRRKKMAQGGSVPEPNKANAEAMQKGATSSGIPSMDDIKKNVMSGLGMAEGGEAHASIHGDKIIDRIMQKMSEGGKVANATPAIADAMPNEFDDLVLDDDLSSSSDGANSGDMLGNAQEDEDRADIVSRVMKQRKMKQHNPRPA